MSARSSRTRVAALDGLRGVALLAVLGYHVAPHVFRGGFLGVDLFFVLSGYLLASILLGEHGRTTGIDIRAYAERRIRRIAPALGVLLLALVIFVPLVANADAHRLRGDVAWSVLGLTNWHFIRDSSSYFAQLGRPSFVRHLWSVAVEVQFYAVCPFLVTWLARRRRRDAVSVLAAGIAASAALMGLLYRSPDPSRAYYGTDTRAAAVLVGVLLAFVLAPGGRQVLGRSRGAIELAPLGAFALLAMAAAQRSRLLYPAGFLAAEGAAAVTIALSMRAGPVASLLAKRPLRWLGRRSYGIYLWHWPLVALVRPGAHGGWPTLPAAAVTIPSALLLGSLSYRYVERPALHPRARRVRATQTRRRLALEAALSALVVVDAAVLVALLPTANPVASTLRVGERALASQTPVTVAPPSPAPAPSTTDPPVITPAPPVATSVTAIGDSVMVSAATALKARLGPSSRIDAKEGRFFAQGVQVAHDLRAASALAEVVVVQLGNNGPISSADVDSLMKELAGARHVLVLTVRNNRDWQDEVNDALRSAALRYPAIRLVDWYSASAGHDDWFQSDGTHFTSTDGPGAAAYADLIVRSLQSLGVVAA